MVPMFLNRHKALALREAQGLTKARSIIIQELAKKWFRELRQFLEDCDALDILQKTHHASLMVTGQVLQCARSRVKCNVN